MSPTPRPLFRLVYFWRFTLIGSTYPLMALYVKEVFGTQTAVGLMYAAISLMSLLTMQMWGYAGDMLVAKRTILLVNVACAISALFVSGFVAWFPLFLMLQLVMAFFAVPFDPILNASVMNSRHGRAHFSEIRSWGTLGFLLALAVASTLADWHGTPWVAFPVNFAGGVVFWLTLWLIRTPHRPPAVRTPFLHVQRFFLLQPHFAWFFATVLLNRMAHEPAVIYQAFVAPDLATEGWHYRAAGSLYFIGAFAELPVFFFGDRIVRRIGEVHCLMISVVLAAIRFALIPTVGLWGLMGLQTLHAASFGLFYIAGITWVNRRTPDSLRASGQTTYMMAGQIAALCGLPLVGWIHDVVGHENLAWIFWGLAALMASTLFGFIRVARFSEAPIYHVPETETANAALPQHIAPITPGSAPPPEPREPHS